MEIKSINDIPMPFSDIDVAEAFYHYSELYMKTKNVSTTVASGNFTTLIYNAVNSQPKHHTPVLAFCDNGDMIFGFMDFYKHWAEIGSEIPYAVTHWMPLPEPPKEV